MESSGVEGIMEAKLFSVTEAAKLLYVTKPTIHNWVRKGLLKAVSFPHGRKKFTKEQIEALLPKSEAEIK